MQRLVASVLAGSFVAAATVGCSGRERRPVVMPARSSAATSTDSDPSQSPGLTPQTRPQPQTDTAAAQTTPAGGPEDSLGERSDGDAGGPGPAPAATPGNPDDGGALSGGTGRAPFRIVTTLEDGSRVTLEWSGKAMQGNDRFDVVRGQ